MQIKECPCRAKAQRQSFWGKSDPVSLQSTSSRRIELCWHGIFALQLGAWGKNGSSLSILHGLSHHILRGGRREGETHQKLWKLPSIYCFSFRAMNSSAFRCAENSMQGILVPATHFTGNQDVSVMRKEISWIWSYQTTWQTQMCQITQCKHLSGLLLCAYSKGSLSASWQDAISVLWCCF